MGKLVCYPRQESPHRHANVNNQARYHEMQESGIGGFDLRCREWLRLVDDLLGEKRLDLTFRQAVTADGVPD